MNEKRGTGIPGDFSGIAKRRKHGQKLCELFEDLKRAIQKAACEGKRVVRDVPPQHTFRVVRRGSREWIA